MYILRANAYSTTTCAFCRESSHFLSSSSSSSSSLLSLQVLQGPWALRWVIQASMSFTYEPMGVFKSNTPGLVLQVLMYSDVLYWQPTGPNPLYHRDDQVDRPRAMGVWIPSPSLLNWICLRLQVLMWTEGECVLHTNVRFIDNWAGDSGGAVLPTSPRPELETPENPMAPVGVPCWELHSLYKSI